MSNDKLILLLVDLYLLRFKMPNWYELTDYLRDKLREDGVEIQYTKDDLLYNLDGKQGSIKYLIREDKK